MPGSIAVVPIILNGLRILRRCLSLRRFMLFPVGSDLVQQTQSIHAGLVCLALMATTSGVGRGESLEEAWAIALAQNDRLAAAQMEQVAASAGARAAAAERIPNLSLRGGYTLRSDEPSFLVRDPVGGLGTFEFPYAQQNSAMAAASVRMPLYTSGRIENSIRCAEAREQAAEFDASQARLDLLFAVGESYLAVLRAEREVEVAEREHKSLTAHAADVERLHSLERVSRSDLLAAQAAAAAAEHRRLQQYRTLEVARGRYNRLLGRPLATPAAFEEIHLPPLTSSFDELVQTACEKRPDLQRLLAISESHERTSSSTRAEARPQVAAELSWQYEENRFGSPQSLGTVAVVMDWNLFDGGRTNRTADAEQFRAAGARHLVEDLKSQIAVDLLEAWNQCADAAERLDVATQNTAHAAENLRVTRERYGRGMALNSDVLKAQTAWTESMRDYHNATYLRVLAQLRLRYVAGLL